MLVNAYILISKATRSQVIVVTSIFMVALFILLYKHETVLKISSNTIHEIKSNIIESASDEECRLVNESCKKWADAPSLSIMCRAYSGSVLEYYNVFLVGYHLFWPRDQWPNSDLVVVLDDESELDHRLGSVLANMPPYPKVYYEKMPTEQTFCAKDRRIGYSRQQYSNFYSDLYSNKKYIGIVDSDAMFSTMVIPETLFVDGKPRIYG